MKSWKKRKAKFLIVPIPTEKYDKINEKVPYQSLSGGSRERISCMMRERNSSGSAHIKKNIMFSPIP